MTGGLDQVAASIKLAGRNVVAARKAALDAIGLQLTAWAQLDFRDKSAGKTAGGVTWKPIKITTIGGRLIGASDNTTGRRTRSGVGEQVRRMLRRDAKGGNRAMRAGIIYRACTDPSFVPAFFAKVQTEWANHKIGVDTGRLANSMKAGQPGHFRKTGGNAVTIGSQIKYAKFFDAVRPIFGPNFIDQHRQKALEDMAVRVYDRAIKLP